MSKLYLVFCLVFYTGIIAQSITIDDNSRDASQLVQLLGKFLYNGIKHFYFSKSTAYFNNNTSAFPIRRRNHSQTNISEGKYTGNNLSSQLNNNF
jgi:hypothetical protein